LRRKIGDIYQVDLDDGNAAIIQHVGVDATQLGSAVVYVVPYLVRINGLIDYDASLKAGTGFFAHVFLKAGETLGVWRKVTWSNYLAREYQLWAICDQADRQCERPDSWVVWHSNQEMRPPVNRNELGGSELGLVINPRQIVERIKIGKYSIFYPLIG
jgi:hypothetical protein